MTIDQRHHASHHHASRGYRAYRSRPGPDDDEEGSDGGANDFESGDEGGSNDEFDTPVAAPIGKPPAQVDDDAEGGSEKERDSEKDDGNSGDQGDQAMMGNEMGPGSTPPIHEDAEDDAPPPTNLGEAQDGSEPNSDDDEVGGEPTPPVNLEASQLPETQGRDSDDDANGGESHPTKMDIGGDSPATDDDEDLEANEAPAPSGGDVERINDEVDVDSSHQMATPPSAEWKKPDLPDRNFEEALDTTKGKENFYSNVHKLVTHVHHAVDRAGHSIGQTKSEAMSLLNTHTNYNKALDELSAGLKKFNVGVKAFREVVAKRHEDNTKRLSEQLSKGLETGIAAFDSAEAGSGSLLPSSESGSEIGVRGGGDDEQVEQREGGGDDEQREGDDEQREAVGNGEQEAGGDGDSDGSDVNDE